MRLNARMSRIGVAAAGVVALLAVAGCSSSADGAEQTPSPTGPKSGIVEGVLAVEADWSANVQGGNTTIDGPCVVETGYDDQREGAQVVVADAAGKTIALGELKSEGLQIVDGSTDMLDTWCGFSFRLDVPKGEDFYSVAIGSRDPIQHPADEFFGDPIDVSLGDIPSR